MELELSDEQKLVQKTAGDFAKNEVLPKAAEIDRNHRHPKELVARMAELGLMGVAVPEEYGGAGFDTVSYVVGLEGISRGRAATGGVIRGKKTPRWEPVLQ